MARLKKVLINSSKRQSSSSPQPQQQQPTFIPLGDELAIMSQRNLTGDGTHTPLLADNAPQEYGATEGRDTPTLEQGTFSRNLGVIEAFAIVISIVIGSGVFTSPGSIDSNVPSPGAALVMWLVGGVLAWTGASTLAELGTAIPGEGLLRRMSVHFILIWMAESCL